MTVEIVELALPDGPLVGSELEDAFASKIGGRPTWPFSAKKLESLGVKTEELKCKSCGSDLFLVLQMDAPWMGEESRFDRIIYLFGCNSRICTETQGAKAWTSFILQLPSFKLGEGPKASKAQVSLWDSVMLGEQSKVATEEIQELCIKDKSWYDKAHPVGFPPVRLNICEEMISEKSKKIVEEDEDDVAIPEAYSVAADGDEKWDLEAYESSSHPMGVDKFFLGFQKRTAYYPRQCVRFSPAGTPLLFHQEAIPLPGVCSKCGQQRVFELQLMPAILSILPCNNEAHLKHLPAQLRGQHSIFGDAMEWGTLLVYSCGTCTRSDAPLLIAAQTHTQIESV